MTQPLSLTYLGVNYALRPAKQVERRMLLDALQILGFEGFPIRDYQYTGFGSVWFVDFVLFHKVLGIKQMLSAEGSSGVTKRVRFNRPFACVDTVMEMSRNVIPYLDQNLRHILWLDYDQRLTREHLDDARMAASHLSPESILVITVDTEPLPAPDDSPLNSFEHFREVAGDYFDPRFTVEAFADDALPSVMGRLLGRAIHSGLTARPRLRFLPLFKFVYADGHRMLTIGGMIGGRREKNKLDASVLSQSRYVRRSLDDPAFEIEVPPLTRRERLLLDQNMPCAEDWLPEEFELSKEVVEKYREIYRFFPGYEELLV